MICVARIGHKYTCITKTFVILVSENVHIMFISIGNLIQ